MSAHRHWIMAWLALALANSEAGSWRLAEPTVISQAWMSKADLTFRR